MQTGDIVENDHTSQFYLWVLNNLSYHDLELGYLLAAEREATECYELTVARYTDENYNLWTVISTLGEIRLEQRRYEEAESLLKRSLELVESADYVRGEAEVAWCLAESYARSGKLDLARDYANRGLQLVEAPRVRTQLLATLVRVSLGAASYEESEILLADCLARGEEAFPRDHPWFSLPQLMWGELRRTQGRFAEAEGHLQRALAIVESRLRPDHPRAGEILLELAALRDEQGRGAEADELRARGRAMREREGCLI